MTANQGTLWGIRELVGVVRWRWERNLRDNEEVESQSLSQILETNPKAFLTGTQRCLVGNRDEEGSSHCGNFSHQCRSARERLHSVPHHLRADVTKKC